jgi:hypothetical protein
MDPKIYGLSRLKPGGDCILGAAYLVQTARQYSEEVESAEII